MFNAGIRHKLSQILTWFGNNMEAWKNKQALQSDIAQEKKWTERNKRDHLIIISVQVKMENGQ